MIAVDSDPGDRYAAKAAAELAAADDVAPKSATIRSAGDPMARVVVVKGERGPAEESGGEALSGSDGEAIAKALEALGFDPDSVFRTISRSPDDEPALRAQRVRRQIESVDPHVVIALDAAAREDVCVALGVESMRFGEPIVVAGRTVVAVNGFERSLSDENRKLQVWRQLKTVVPTGPVW